MCLAIPMRVEWVAGKEALVQQQGMALKVRTDLLEEVAVGDYVLVHAGFALQRVDEEEARQTLALLEELTDASGR
ncbi:MAG: HypC/HybG/HupF family hydrogenase formation chaperone [Armatimonadota bacterium]|nr:HypC/HybG/HupF family hydrogenase formation chaperone [Armatimonadota bacterium]